MTEEQKVRPVAKPPIKLSAWLVVVAGLVLYGLTVNHWVTFRSLSTIAQFTGWDWHPRSVPWRPVSDPPLFFVLTLPLRALPVAWQPLALNLFTAVCAALTLGLLARSVRLMSHDRTREQRLREGGEYALLSVRMAFLPVAFAVLMLAGEMAFWEDAISATGEMLNVLVFAFLIYVLLDYRISHREGRLKLFAFVYGLGLANNWAMVGFFPCFLLAVIWLKRLTFFNWKFLLRMVGFGLIGMLLYLLMPAMAAASGDGSFWDLLRLKVGEQRFYIRTMMGLRYYVIVASVPTLLPLLFASINWPSFEGELSAGAHDLSRGMFRVLHLVFLALGLVMFFDVSFSPSPRRLGMPGFITFYYMAALSVGYFSGYVLLVFGKEPVRVWGKPSIILQILNKVVLVALWLAAIALPAYLFYQNVPHIRAGNGPAVTEFGAAMAKSLPDKPAFVLADDRARLLLTMGASQKLGTSDKYIFLDSEALPRREYLQYLADHYPLLKKTLLPPQSLPPVLANIQVTDLLAHLLERNSIYYLHPSFGYYFEKMYFTPHGLGGDLNLYPTNVVITQAPLPAAGELRVNQEFWVNLKKGPLALLTADKDLSADARTVCAYYAQSLNYWGTILQKAGTQPQIPALLKDAGDDFALALELNPENFMARVNRQFNARLRGLPPPPGPPINIPDFATRTVGWDIVLSRDGPADDPDMNKIIGRHLAEHGNFLQATHLFERCLQLRPNDPDAELDIAKCYVDLNMLDQTIDLVGRIRAQGKSNPVELLRIEGLAYTKKGKFDIAEKLFLDACNKNPKDEHYFGLLIEFYRIMGYTTLHGNAADKLTVPQREAASVPWFKQALAAINQQLPLINAPANSGAASELPEALLRKAEIEMMLKDYNAAIKTLTQVAERQTDNPVPILNRAISELQASRLDAAKSDYLALEKMLSEPNYVVYFGLAEVAQKQKDTASQIRYSKQYLKYAPSGTPEYTNVTQQLQKLEGR